MRGDQMYGRELEVDHCLLRIIRSKPHPGFTHSTWEVSLPLRDRQYHHNDLVPKRLISQWYNRVEVDWPGDPFLPNLLDDEKVGVHSRIRRFQIEPQIGLIVGQSRRQEGQAHRGGEDDLGFLAVERTSLLAVVALPPRPSAYGPRLIFTTKTWS